MKLSIVVAFFTATSVVAEGGIRKRELTPSAGGSGSVSATCFSEVSTVQIFGKATATSMRDLQVGDRVFTGDSYQTVYAFAHLDTDTKANFVQIETEKGNVMEATGAHFVFVDGKNAPVRTDSIKVGDVLQGAAVTKISTVQRSGLYAPLTVDGKLVVDGVKASSYVSLDQAENHWLFGSDFHSVSHFGISPFRLLCTAMSSEICVSYNEDGIPHVLSMMNQFFDWLVSLPAIVQAMVLAAYLAITTVTWTMECLLTVATAPVLAFGFLAVTIITTSQVLGVSVKAEKMKSV